MATRLTGQVGSAYACVSCGPGLSAGGARFELARRCNPPAGLANRCTRPNYATHPGRHRRCLRLHRCLVDFAGAPRNVKSAEEVCNLGLRRQCVDGPVHGSSRGAGRIRTCGGFAPASGFEPDPIGLYGTTPSRGHAADATPPAFPLSDARPPQRNVLRDSPSTDGDGGSKRQGSCVPARGTSQAIQV